MSVLLETSLGDITIDLYVDQCPNTIFNFIKLCKIKYYNQCLFYRVQKNFLVQTGDPSGTGSGGNSIYGILGGEKFRFFRDEICQGLKHKMKGTVSMANAGENLNSSQFYITTAENLDYLNGKHTVFGQVVEGFDILMKINDAYCDSNERPYQNIRYLSFILYILLENITSH
jgi:peptidyl-prolyl cis-trans isomerase-like 4